jgi:hypothetical protein
LYNCGCEEYKTAHTVLNLGVSDSFKQLLKDGSTAFKHLHKKGSYKPEDLKTEKPYQKLIQSTFDAFDFAIKDNDMPEVMRTALQDDARLFGSLKANAQLFEASKMLLNADGRLKPFSEVSKDFDKLNVNYNQNYLEAEYEFAVASSQAAAQWANLGDRYNLQYRTAQDERVRASHQVLADITLPKEDPFWSSFYPPNGWRCRCVAVEVLKGKYDESDSAKAITAGEKATTEIGKDGKNRLEIFRFNPGAQKVVFPPAHPYGKVKGAKEVQTMFSGPTHEELKTLRKEKDKGIKEWASSKIKKGEHLTVTGKQFKSPEVRISRSNIENLLKHISNVEDKEAVRDIEKIIKSSTFLESKDLENKNSKNYGSKVARGVESYNYYLSKWNDIDIEINMEVMKNSYEQPYAILFNKK